MRLQIKFVARLSQSHPILQKVRRENHLVILEDFLHIALGSLAEVDTQLVLAQEFGYLSKEDVDCNR